MRIGLLTREYPPEVYGGAGVHVGFLVPRLRELIDVDVHCFGGTRADAHAHAAAPGLERANAALQTLSVDLSMVAAVEGVDLVHVNSPILAADRPFGVPVLAAAHGCPATWWQAARPGEPLDPSLRWHEELTGRALRVCDLVIAPSASHAALVQQVYRLPSAPQVVHNGRSPLPVPSAPQHDHALTAGRLWDEGVAQSQS